MSSVETFINSYDVGKQPYIHDPKRGHWERKCDFYLAAIVNASSMRNFVLFSSLLHYAESGGYVIIPILFSIFLFVIPVFFIQSFMGQFSSTGYISVFRISPLFKGIGYVILALNLSSIIYNSSVSSYPLLFFLKSFQFNTTWMYCNNSWNTKHCSETVNDSITTNATDSLEPEFEYFYHGVLKLSHEEDSFNVSYTIILGELFIWIIVGCVITNGLTTVSRFLRCTIITTLGIALIIFMRFMYLSEWDRNVDESYGLKQLSRLLKPHSWLMSIMVSSSILGKGWGTTLTMASFQPFSSNVEKYSFIIPLSMGILSCMLGGMLRLMDQSISNKTVMSITAFEADDFESLFVVPPYVFGKMEASQFWSVLFYLMLFLSEISLLVIQSFAILASITDEFLKLRTKKCEITIGLCTIGFLASTLFATEYVAVAYKQLLQAGFASQLLICFLEILIIVWIYGRDRFLRDIRFMLMRNLSVWKFYVIRYITPAFILFTLFINGAISIIYLYREPFYIKCFVFIVKWLPWVYVPGYIIAKLITTIGTIPHRFRKSIQPNDWYPADSVDKQKYELTLGASDVSQQLLEMDDPLA